MSLLLSAVFGLGLTLSQEAAAMPPPRPAPSPAEVAALLPAGASDEIHVVSVLGLPDAYAVGERVTAHSATLRGVARWTDEGLSFGTAGDQSAPVLAAAGWVDAPPEERARLATVWTDHVLLQFDGSVESEALSVWGNNDRPEFTTPSAEAQPDGGVVVDRWVRSVERGKSSIRELCRVTVRFGPDGTQLDDRRTDCFTVPNQEWFKAQKRR